MTNCMLHATLLSLLIISLYGNTKETMIATNKYEQRNPELDHEYHECEAELRQTTSFIEILCQNDDVLDKLDKCTYNNFSPFDVYCSNMGINRTVQFDDNITVRTFNRVSPEDRGNVFYTKRELHEFHLEYIQETICRNQGSSQSFKRNFMDVFLCCVDI